MSPPLPALLGAADPGADLLARLPPAVTARFGVGHAGIREDARVAAGGARELSGLGRPTALPRPARLRSDPAAIPAPGDGGHLRRRTAGHRRSGPLASVLAPPGPARRAK